MTKSENNVYQFPVSSFRQCRNQNAEFLFQQGLAAEKAGAEKPALELYRKVLDIDPMHAMAWVNIGCIKVIQGRWKLAAAEACFRKAIDIDGSYVLALYNLANCLDTRKKFAEAITYYERALALEPTYTDVLFNLGLCYISVGEKRKALPHFKAFRQHAHPEDPFQKDAEEHIFHIKKHDLQALSRISKVS